MFARHLDLYFRRLELLVINFFSAKFLVSKLSSITFNEFTVKDCVAEEIVHQDGELYMGSLDVDSLFSNISLKETINICINC